jgi:glyoxylase-like metal-dependent hydrolase (beta-lactamase superfamily II)
MTGLVDGLVAPNPGPLTLQGTRTWLVGADRLLIIDPGPAQDEHMHQLMHAVAGRAVDGILLTHAHADHSAAAPRLGRELGAPILASSSTLARLSLSGRVLAEGDVIPVDASARAERVTLQVLETPGHSADHLSFLILPDRWMFTGDLVLGSGSSAVLHPDGRVGEYLASLRKLQALRPTRLLPGHGPEVADAEAKLEEYRLHRLERERQIESAIAAGIKTVGDIRASVYGPLPAGLEAAADASVSAHLAHLTERGIDAPAPGPGLLEETESEGAEWFDSGGGGAR